jgi:hypothetical protein
MSDPQIYFAIYFRELPEPLSEIWKMFCDYLHVEIGLPPRWSIMEKGTLRNLKRSPDGIGEIIDQQGVSGFHISTLGLEERWITLTLGPVGGGMMHPEASKIPGRMLSCRFESGANVPPSWHALIEQISSRWITYGGFEWDHRYMGWQTTIWADDYERVGGLLPKGMEQKVIPSIDGLSPARIQLDISKNPGRQSAKDGQFRAVAAKMWLGNDFWKYSPSVREEVANADFLIDSRNYPDFVYIHSWPHPFTRPDGEQGRVQQKLWQLLFREDCEWPPGSGGISDTPMYGPPALMPSIPEIS